MKRSRARCFPRGPSGRVAFGLLVVMLSGHAAAFKFDVGNPDITMRWDNTIRYNLGVRAQGQDPLILNSPLFNQSDSKFNAGDVVTNRVDLLSEFDFVYRGDTGFRLSGMGWYDEAYHSDAVKGNPALGTQNTFPHNRYTEYIKRYNRGPSGELLDAFVFKNFNLGAVPVSVKVGQHNIYWGESLFSLANGIAYSQGPVDFRKALANPGTQAKELFLPLNQVSAQAQLSDTWSIAGQYYLDWKPTRLPDGGTYFGSPDFLTLGGGTNLSGVPFTGIGNRPRNIGDWGVMTKWSPAWLDGTMGLYFRRFSEKLPWLAFNPAVPNFQVNYASNTQLVGVSLSKQIAGVSVGAEVSYRRNAALNSAVTTTGEGARGDTLHGLINAIAYLGKSPLWDAASLTTELTYSRWLRLTSNAALFDGVGTPACTNASGVPGSGDKWDGCITKDAIGATVMFQPTWYQVFPSVDLKMPLVYSVGIRGNGATLGGDRQGNGEYSVGLRAEVRNQYFVTLAYNGYLGHFKNNGTAVTTNNTAGAIYTDRGWVSLTFTSTF